MLPTNVYKFTVPANGLYRLTVAGEYFKILSSTGDVEVTADFGRLGPIRTGQGLEKTPFKFLNVQDLSGANNDLQLVIGDENFIDGVNGTFIVSRNVAPQSPNFSNTQKTVTNVSAVLLAANPARQYLMVQNNDSAATLYLAFGKAATAADGVRIIPGGAYEMNGAQSTQAIHCISDAANTNKVITVEG